MEFSGRFVGTHISHLAAASREVRARASCLNLGQGNELGQELPGRIRVYPVRLVVRAAPARDIHGGRDDQVAVNSAKEVRAARVDEAGPAVVGRRVRVQVQPVRLQLPETLQGIPTLSIEAQEGVRPGALVHTDQAVPDNGKRRVV